MALGDAIFRQVTARHVLLDSARGGQTLLQKEEEEEEEEEIVSTFFHTAESYPISTEFLVAWEWVDGSRDDKIQANLWGPPPPPPPPPPQQETHK